MTNPMSGESRATAITIVARGHPAPQGSKKAFAIKKGGVYTGKAALVEQTTKTLKPWRQAVTSAAQDAMTAHYQNTGTYFPLDGPLAAAITFTMPRPKSHYRTGKYAGQLRDGAPTAPAGQPDLSKLLRATEDALTAAGVFRDDAQLVTYTRLAKRYPHTGDDTLNTPGAVIRITTLPGTRCQ